MSIMVEMLPSYTEGMWFAATGDGVTVRDATTGEPVVRVSSEGLQPGRMLAHARDVGGPALRSMTYPERAAMIKALAKYIGAATDELYAAATRTGATRVDAAFDIEGGIGTLFSYAGKASALPAAGPWLDGEAEFLGKEGTFLAQHLLLPLHGAAVHINAYNFPVWGMLEKLAPTLLAGVPAIIKPATQTAHVTEVAFRRLIDAGVLPHGAVQLICGSVGDLLDHLTGQDVLTFTGSASTAQKLRSHPQVVASAVRFNAEADSLNCSILGPDAEPGTPEFDLFVREVSRELTHKTGQKCTAIRRAFVPKRHADAAVDALADRLSKVKVGNPAHADVKMGPLVSLAQREDVLAAVGALQRAGELVVGDPPRVELVDADVERGAFVPPMLLRCDDLDRPEPHEIEAFGPVSTLLPYETTDEVIAAAARGNGSLVGSVVTHDPAFARDVVLGAAAWHGRMLVLDRDDARESTGHGVAMPQLVHGGPGRAGGGEELGGLRALHRYLQRTAVQGSPEMITAITG